MPPENRDSAYLWDMLDAASAIQEFTAGVSLEDYDQSTANISTDCETGPR